ncbi:hypothetical protein AB3R30_26095 [Leptolyngbyaceae cyanobacterium UHCC 1019]
MSKDNITNRRQTILDGVGTAIAQALERHRRLGQSIAVWQDGKVVILTADQIPLPSKAQLDSSKTVEL